MSLILAALAAVIVFCGYLILDMMRLNAKRRKSLQSRLTGDALGAQTDEFESVGFNNEMSPLAQQLFAVMRGMGINTEEAIRKLELRFARAGIDSSDGPVYYLFFQRVISYIVAIFGIMLLVKGINVHALALEAGGALLISLAFYGPYLYLQNTIDKRTKLLQRAFPDTLDLLLICVESGLALDAALNRVCNELSRAYPEMTAELNRTRLELSLLNDRVKALMNLGDRTGMVAFRSLVVALIQSERFGTSLTDTLRVLSEDFRLQRLMNAEAKAARLPVLLTIPLIFLLMPALFIIVLGPAIIKTMHST